MWIIKQELLARLDGIAGLPSFTIQEAAPTDNEKRKTTTVCMCKYSFFLRGFISAMAESQVTSPSDANLDIDDDDTLKGKYTVKNISV